MATLHKILTGFAVRTRNWLESGEMADRAEAFDVPSDTLCGYCGVGTAYLSTLLSNAGIEHTIYMSRKDYGDHVFIEAADHIVDVTASQFNGYPWLNGERLADVEVRHVSKRDASVHLHWDTSLTVDSVVTLADLLDKEDWPEEQKISNTEWFKVNVAPFLVEYV